MPDNYTTFEKDGRWFRGVYCIDGDIKRCSSRRSSMGAAVRDAAIVRRSILNKKQY